MEWRELYLDAILVPLACSINMAYHIWLWHKIRNQPFTTTLGANSRGRRLWVAAIMKDNDKRNILAVQTTRNVIMGSTLMATASIYLSTGIAAVISSTYSIKKPLEDAIYGAHGELMLPIKYATLLTGLLSSFFFHTLAIRFLNQANILINAPPDPLAIVTPEYVTELLERGCLLNTVGNRLFYAALPFLLWIAGPVFVFLGSVAMVPVLYSLDFVRGSGQGKPSINGSNEKYESL